MNLLRQRMGAAAPVIIAMDDRMFATAFQIPYRTVIDIGAHAGEFTSVARRFAPDARVLAFEPLPGPFLTLRSIIDTCASGSHAFPIALGESDDVAEMTEYPFTPCSSLLAPTRGARAWFPYMIAGVRRSVRVSRLDDVLDPEDVASPVLMKIDAQGYEHHILRGAERTLERVDTLIIETSAVCVYEGQWLFDDVRRWLEERGLRYVGSLQHHRGFFGGAVVQEDSLFTRSRHHEK